MLGLKGCYVVFGADRAPEAHYLTERELSHFRDCIALVEDFSKAVESIFGRGFESVIPCEKPYLMEITQTYEGPYQRELKGMCAQILLGMPVGQHSDDPKDGGARDRISPKKPRKPRPGGAAEPMEYQTTQEVTVNE